MKKVLKFLILPIAFTCCSMAINAKSVKITSFAIVDEDLIAKTFKLCAFVNITRTSDKTARYSYCYIDKDNQSHTCGGGSFSLSMIEYDYPLTVCYPIETDILKGYCPITFRCEITIVGESSVHEEMAFNNKTIERFDISESTNNQELDTGFSQDSTFPDPGQNYHYEDVITCLNFEDLRVNELYYDIDISYLRFKYRNGLNDTLKGDFKFAFYDRYNLFPDFEVGEESMYRYIPLKLNKDGDECYFTFAQTIYFDPTTHNSSTIKKDRYIPYNHLMLPFANANDLKFLPCYIELKIKSHCEFTVYGKFTITYLKKYLGFCEDSEYCEEMRQDDEVNIREKVIEVVI